MSTTILDRIKAYKLEEIKADKAKRAPADVETEAKTAAPGRPLAQRTIEDSKTGYGLIAEIKKASPSKGLIRADFNPADLA